MSCIQDYCYIKKHTLKKYPTYVNYTSNDPEDSTNKCGIAIKMLMDQLFSSEDAKSSQLCEEWYYRKIHCSEFH